MRAQQGAAPTSVPHHVNARAHIIERTSEMAGLPPGTGIERAGSGVYAYVQSRLCVRVKYEYQYDCARAC